MIEMMRWNGHGSGWRTKGEEKFRALRIYEESGSVRVWAEVVLPHKFVSETTEVLQYLEPWQAVQVASGLIRSALRAAWRHK